MLRQKHCFESAHMLAQVSLVLLVLVTFTSRFISSAPYYKVDISYGYGYVLNLVPGYFRKYTNKAQPTQ